MIDEERKSKKKKKEDFGGRSRYLSNYRRMGKME